MAASMGRMARRMFSKASREPRAGAEKKPPFLLSLRSHPTFILVTVCLAVFTDIFLYGLIVPVVPFSLTVQVGVPEDQVQQWTAILLACYTVALFVGSPVAGFFADHFESRRWPMLLGLFALVGSTMMLCLGKTIAVLAVGRLLQGLSAAVIWSVGLALLADTMGREIGVSMGYVNIAMSMGLLVSPLIGGVVYGAVGYYPVFYVAFGVIFVDIVLRLLLIEKRIAAQWAPGAVTGQSPQRMGVFSPEALEATEALPGDTAAVEDGDREKAKTADAGDPASAPSQGQGLDTSIPPPQVEPTRHPIIELIKNRRIMAALGGVVMQSAVMFAFDTVVPLFVKNTFHWDSVAAGLIFLAIFIPGFTSPIVGMLSDKYGAKWFSFAGFVASIPLLVCMRFVTDNTMAHKVLLTALLALLGLTLTFSNVPMMSEITYAIEDEEDARPGVWGEKGVYGAAYGLFMTAFALGGTPGSLMAGYIVAGPGWSTFTWAISLWCVVGAVIVYYGVGGKTPGLKADEETSG